MERVFVIAAFGTWGGWPALTAVGTVGAVIVAVGLQWWITRTQKHHRPKLELTFDAHAVVRETRAATGAPLPYIRIAVTNLRGRDAAHDVEVVILDIQEYAISPVGSGGRHVWLANPALSWANYALPRLTIPPGGTRYADLGHWVQQEGEAESMLQLLVNPAPASGRHLLPQGGWEIRLAATPTNGDASTWVARVEWTDKLEAGLATPVNIKHSISSI